MFEKLLINLIYVDFFVKSNLTTVQFIPTLYIFLNNNNNLKYQLYIIFIFIFDFDLYIYLYTVFIHILNNCFKDT